jgi:beta-aspartyl-peptidase (threonine type)
MRNFIVVLFIACLITGVLPMNATAGPDSLIAIAIHGGAGTISREKMTPERESEIRAVLEASIHAGHGVLEQGGSSVDAVVAAINIMEDSPLFNAGKGAVFNAEGKNEMDASIMEGAGLNAGAVAAVRHIHNPINLARSVMDESEHVMLMGAGAEEFAREQGYKMTDPSYFHTDFRMEQLKRIQAQEQAAVPVSGDKDEWFSTVGAVALDRKGNIAAGTSTGGTSNKRWGRVGDSPIIGAGTYADNNGCAVSATGHGEYFIRSVVAYDICARMNHSGLSLQESADKVVNEVLVKRGGEGGVIAMDPQGNIAMPFNTPGMYRASIDTRGQAFVGIYRNAADDTAAMPGAVEH